MKAVSAEGPDRYIASACRRKVRYPSYASAKVELERLRERRPDDITLAVYKCGEHYHLGHARGKKADRLRKKDQRRRGKDAMKARERA
jgi:hypothetical protein